VCHGLRIDIEEAPDRYQPIGNVYERISNALGFHQRTASKVSWLGTSGQPELRGIDELLRDIDVVPPQNVAASLQAWTNEMVIGLAEDSCKRHNVSGICVTGPLAENPLLIHALEQHFGNDHVFVPPAPGKESLSIGAALVHARREARPTTELRFTYPALGPEFLDCQIKSELDNCKLICSFFPGVDALIESTCKTLTEGGLVGWFQGRCEFGHRALGFRSILANPFTPYINENINRFLKHREDFHPFVISVAAEAASEYFEKIGANARTISSVYAIKDASRNLFSNFLIQTRYVRVHTVSSADNHLFWALLQKMQTATGHPLLINSSFNLPNEPLVMTPRDAIRTFYASGLDVLAIGRFLLSK